MIQGWHNDNYLVLFNDVQEAQQINHAYGADEHLPGFTIVGLFNWDDFILAGSGENFFRIPTVPLDLKYLESFTFEVNPAALTTDERFKNKVKWYVKPIVFGGDPSDPENLSWVTLEQHTELVQWWAKIYRDMPTSAN